MNNRKRQQIRAMNMLIYSYSNGKFGYDKLLYLAKNMTNAIICVLNQASTTISDLWYSVQSFASHIEPISSMIECRYIENIECECSYTNDMSDPGYCEINAESEHCEETYTDQIEHSPVRDMIVESEDDLTENSVSEHKIDIAETILKWSSICICILTYPIVIYKLYQWIKYLFS